MSALALRKDRAISLPRYERHKPEQTLLYQIIEQHYSEFSSLMDLQGRPLPFHVKQEFIDYLKCGRLEYGFIRVQCTDCHKDGLVAFSCKRRGFCPSCGARRMAESAALLVDDVLPEQPIRQWVLSFPFQLRFLFANNPKVMGKVLGIVYRALSGTLLKKAGLMRKEGMTGAVTLIQRFGSALNLNVHFHMLFVDGVYSKNQYGKVTFHRTKAPDKEELRKLVNTISHRVARYLVRQGLLEKDEESSYLHLDGLEEDPMQQLLGHSITYRVAVGARQGQKVFTLQTVTAKLDDGNDQAAKVAGFSLHAGVVAQHWERKKLERLCRYITRPAISEKRLSVTPAGNVRYQLKTPYRDGTTHIVFEPMDFLSKLAALVPKPRVNLTRFHGVFAANSHFRSAVTPARKGRRSHQSDKTPAERRRAMNWAQRLKRVFNIDVDICLHCGGRVKVLACIEDQPVVEQILNHLDKKGTWLTPMSLLPEGRGPPVAALSF
jgi:hypothetical protein